MCKKKEKTFVSMMTFQGFFAQFPEDHLPYQVVPCSSIIPVGFCV